MTPELEAELREIQVGIAETIERNREARHEAQRAIERIDRVLRTTRPSIEAARRTLRRAGYLK